MGKQDLWKPQFSVECSKVEIYLRIGPKDHQEQTLRAALNLQELDVAFLLQRNRGTMDRMCNQERTRQRAGDGGQDTGLNRPPPRPISEWLW